MSLRTPKEIRGPTILAFGKGDVLMKAFDSEMYQKYLENIWYVPDNIFVDLFI